MSSAVRAPECVRPGRSGVGEALGLGIFGKAMWGVTPLRAGTARGPSLNAYLLETRRHRDM
jgi:hypothetical protein